MLEAFWHISDPGSGTNPGPLCFCRDLILTLWCVHTLQVWQFPSVMFQQPFITSLIILASFCHPSRYRCSTLHRPPTKLTAVALLFPQSSSPGPRARLSPQTYPRHSAPYRRSMLGLTTQHTCILAHAVRSRRQPYIAAHPARSIRRIACSCRLELRAFAWREAESQARAAPYLDLPILCPPDNAAPLIDFIVHSALALLCRVSLLVFLNLLAGFSRFSA